MNAVYRAGIMCGGNTIAQTFNRDLAEDFGIVMGNYSLWSNLTFWWGPDFSLRRTPYDAQNGVSEDPVLTGAQGASIVAGAQAYGAVAGVRFAAVGEDSAWAAERSGNAGAEQTAVFRTEQAAREGILRAVQPAVEDAGALGFRLPSCRAGAYRYDAHPAFSRQIVRDEWGFQGVFGQSGANAVQTAGSVRNDPLLAAERKEAMTWQTYVLANSNAMDGYTPHTYLEPVRTVYDTALSASTFIFAFLTILFAILYVFKSWEDE